MVRGGEVNLYVLSQRHRPSGCIMDLGQRRRLEFDADVAHDPSKEDPHFIHLPPRPVVEDRHHHPGVAAEVGIRIKRRRPGSEALRVAILAPRCL
jgi:hypothetical protein